MTKTPTRSRNLGTSASSVVPIYVDEPSIVPEAQDLPQIMQEKMVVGFAPSDVNLRPVNFGLITNNTIIMHESPVSFDINALFNSPNPGPTDSPVFQLQVLTMLTLGTLLFCNQVPIPRARFFNRIFLGMKILTPRAWLFNHFALVNLSQTLARLTQLFSKV